MSFSKTCFRSPVTPSCTAAHQSSFRVVSTTLVHASKVDRPITPSPTRNRSGSGNTDAEHEEAAKKDEKEQEAKRRGSTDVRSLLDSQSRQTDRRHRWAERLENETQGAEGLKVQKKR